MFLKYQVTTYVNSISWWSRREKNENLDKIFITIRGSFLLSQLLHTSDKIMDIFQLFNNFDFIKS